MKSPDELPAWLKPHLPPAAPRDATATRRPIPSPSTLTPEVQRRINNLSATMGRTVGPVTPGNHPVGFSDVANLVGGLGRDAVKAVLPLDKLEEAASAARGNVTEPAPIDYSKMDPRRAAKLQLDAQHGGGADEMLAAIMPAATRGARATRDIVPEGTQFFDHYSNADLSGGMLEAQYAGTGRTGREAARTNRPDMMHAYMAGARPEPQFKNMPRYRVAVTNPQGLYDAGADADGIVAKFRAKAQKSGKPFDYDAMERAIGDAGYAGYHGEDSKIVKLFGDNPVVPHGETFNLPGERAAAADSVAPSLISHMSLEDMRASLARQRAALDGSGLSPRAPTPALTTATTDGLADARRVLRTMQHNAGAVNMPRVTAVDPEKAAHMAQVYAGLPKNDPNAKGAYDALNKEVGQQFQSIIDNGHKIQFVDSDPYKNSKEMIADVRDNRNLNVLKTPADNFHPYMTPEQNDKFRAVHDWLAHAGEGHSFGPVGEENAYRVHASTLSPEAQRALATETRGQNSWVNFGPNSHLPPAQRPFAEQKAALWPAELTGDYHEMPTVAPNSVAADSVAAQVPAFYSRLGNAIQNAPMKKGTSAQWLAHLSKNVSSEERDWTGVDKFLKSATGPVTQDQVQQVFDAGKIKLGQKTIGRGSLLDEVETLDRQRAHMEDDSPEYEANWNRAQALRDQIASGAPATKFGQYTEPGGTNYRENLTTLQRPEMSTPEIEAVQARYDAAKRAYNTNANAETDREFMDAGAALRHMTEGAPTPFRSSHFDAPDILLHTRTKDRTAPDGSRVLHAEEIQSDWHQKGRSVGYDGSNDATIRDLTARRDAAYKDYTDAAVRYNMGEIDRPTMMAAFDAHNQANYALTDARDAGGFNPRGVPNAPFKKTEDWQLLGIKQLIDDAVRGGYDHVAWTPGQMQADRYSLRKQADKITYRPESGQFAAWKDGRMIHDGTYDAKALPDVIGKEATDKLLATQPASPGTGVAPFHTLEGDDLNVGGQGMKSFYDNMLPKNLNKYFKSLNLGDGTPQLGTTEMQFNKPGELSVQQMPSFPITPALRQMVLTKGQPLLGGLLGALGLGAYGAAQGDNSPPQY